MYDLPIELLDDGDDAAEPLVPAAPLALALPIVALLRTNLPLAALGVVEPDVPVVLGALALSWRQPTTVIASLLAALCVLGVCAVATTQPSATAKAVAVHV